MNITSNVFEAHLKCPTKCWLLATAKTSFGSAYSNWLNAHSQCYRVIETERLIAASPQNVVMHSPSIASIKVANWRLASCMTVQVKIDSCTLESEIHAVERLPAESRGKSAQFIPIRFIFRNKLTKDDKLLLAFDVFTLSTSLGRKICCGKIIYGDDHSTLKLKTSATESEVRRRIDKISVMLSSSDPPDLVLNRHCVECEFQTHCRQQAIDSDDLSQLSSMTAKERQKFRDKGIFTVTQLSYTFRPHRRPKRFRDKKEKYHHSLKALAIREKKIHIVGSPELKIEGTPIYLDVEGVPDRDFYYLIGVRIGHGEFAVQHSLWADTIEDEYTIWQEFLRILEAVEKPVIIHYGSYETEFIKKMNKHYLAPARFTSNPEDKKTINLLSILHGQVYFPTYSNGLKDIGVWLGFAWSKTSPVGINSVACRHEWEGTRNPLLKARLITYNTEDCQAAAIVTQALFSLHSSDPNAESTEQSSDTVYVRSLKRPQRRWGNFVSPFKELEDINVTAWWDYQRDRIYVKSHEFVKQNRSRNTHERTRWLNHLPVSKFIDCAAQPFCPFCGEACDAVSRRKRTLYDLVFGRTSVKRRIVNYCFNEYWCGKCQRRYGEPVEFWHPSHFGRSLVAYILYEAIELYIPFTTIQKNISRFFNLDLPDYTLRDIRNNAAEGCKEIYGRILEHLVTGHLLHVDETEVSIRGKPAYVWVFTNLQDVAYLYAAGREGAFLHEMLKDFKGVLVSDFYGAYDSINCAQQKCLVHLIRDLNDDVLAHPYDEELKTIVRDFTALLKPIIETIDRMGLKKRFLGKHRAAVNRFYRKLAKSSCRSEAARKCMQRFEKNREKLFTFLSHDGIPWNNNNAEHAIKMFAQLRDIVRGSFTEASVRGYLILLSISQTCKCNGLDFFDFLRSGEKDIYTFAKNRRRRRPTKELKVLPADESAQN